MAVGARDMLIIFGPKGEHVAELPVPSISQAVTVGDTSFQVSYGRDANDLLTAILAPNPSQPQDIHFNVLNKSVDADKQAVVTVTFARNLNRVMVDPGYIGTVQVNAEQVKHRNLADAEIPPAPAPVSPILLPVAGSGGITPRDNFVPGSATGSVAGASQPLFWSEAVTRPDGNTPKVGRNEIKLVQVQGPVTVETPSGKSEDGAEGMVVPSGSTVVTSDNASAALFMGGVNSARLLPNTEAKFDQNVAGSVRATTIDLRHGTIFSRVGRRSGENQDYQVRTPEGVASARGTEFADVRQHGHHYVFVGKGIVALLENGRQIGLLEGTMDNIAMGAMPPADDMAQVLHNILLILQPFNVQLQGALQRIAAGTATPADQSYYNLVQQSETVTEAGSPFGLTHPSTSSTIVSSTPGTPSTGLAGPVTTLPNSDGSIHGQTFDTGDYLYSNPTLDIIPPERRAENQNLYPYGTAPLTPY